MPGLYDSLDAEMLRAGPRRVTLAPAEPAWSRRPYRIHDEPPPYVPPLPVDKPPLDAGFLTPSGHRLHNIRAQKG